MNRITDETHVEYAYEFEDGEVWEGFDDADQVLEHVRAEALSDREATGLYDGHVVKRTRRVVLSDWEPVSLLIEPASQDSSKEQS